VDTSTTPATVAFTDSPLSVVVRAETPALARRLTKKFELICAAFVRGSVAELYSDWY
jgi:hypothetical protein